MNGIIHGEEVTGGLGHLLVVQLNVAVAEVRARHLGHVGPDGLVVVEGHHQVVLDQILTAHTEVVGVPVVELVAHLVELLLLNTALLGVFSLQEDVVVDLRSHEVSGDAESAHLLTEQITLEVMSDGVVSHVNGGVGQGFNQELLIPRKLYIKSGENSYAST